MTKEEFIKRLTHEDIKKIAYLQLKDIENKKMNNKERIHMLKSSLYYNCNEAFGLLGMVLRDNFKKFDHYDKMNILDALEHSEKVGCIEPLLDILEMFESIEPKSRYLYQQIGKIIEVIGRSKKKWLVHILSKYTKSTSRLIRESSRNAISNISK